MNYNNNMYIVKSLNDLEFDEKQRAFVDFIKEKVDTTLMYERIENKQYQKQYVSMRTDLYSSNNLPAFQRIKRIEDMI